MVPGDDTPPPSGSSGEGFELDAPNPQPARAPVPSTAGFLEDDPADTAPPTSEDGVDTRTVAERAGTAVPAAMRAAQPPGYPKEIWSFPFRRPGPLLLAGLAAGLLVLDLIGVYDSLRFMSWLLKGMALVAMARLQMVLVSRSAAGHDSATGWEKALDLGGDAWSRIAFFLIWFLAPSLLVLCLYLFAWQHVVLLLLVLFALVVLPLAILATALGDRGILLPWRVVPWLRRGWMEILLAAGAWAFLIGAEWVVGHQQAAGQMMTLLVGVGLRALTAYLWLVAARALGVLGRSYTI